MECAFIHWDFPVHSLVFIMESNSDDDWSIERTDFIESHVIGTVAPFFFLGEVITIPHKNFSEILYKVLLLSTLFVYNKNQRKI